MDTYICNQFHPVCSITLLGDLGWMRVTMYHNIRNSSTVLGCSRYPVAARKCKNYRAAAVGEV